MSWNWKQTTNVANKLYTCGFCGNKVAPHTGYIASHSSGSSHIAYVMICPNCSNPTFINDKGTQTPSVRLGNNVEGITNVGVATLYNQARDCTSLGAHTATALLCRKILMNLAVQHGADEGKSFVEYIDFLNSKGYVPPNGKDWVDRIRTKGNEATHEIRLIEMDEASQILKFTEMLLKFAYEFPSMLGDK
jgi:hypothetical protein